MKDLKDYTIRQLQQAINEKEREEALNKIKTLPEKYLPYEYTQTITNDEDGEYKNIKLYQVHVDDGCEGHTYVVQFNSNEYHTFNEELIADTVRHHYLSQAEEDGWLEDIYDLDFRVSELGHYGTTFLSVDGTEYDEDDE